MTGRWTEAFVYVCSLPLSVTSHFKGNTWYFEGTLIAEVDLIGRILANGDIFFIDSKASGGEKGSKCIPQTAKKIGVTFENTS